LTPLLRPLLKKLKGNKAMRTRDYEVIFQDNAQLLGYYIEHRATGLHTPWDVGHEALEQYKDLKRIFRVGRRFFNSQCAEYFQEGNTVYNKEGKLGYLHKGEFVSDE
jgi:hypothetical protein